MLATCCRAGPAAVSQTVNILRGVKVAAHLSAAARQPVQQADERAARPPVLDFLLSRSPSASGKASASLQRTSLEANETPSGHVNKAQRAENE